MRNKITLTLNSGISFSHIVGRMGKLESLDVKLFCAAAMDFYRTQVRQVFFCLCLSVTLLSTVLFLILKGC